MLNTIQVLHYKKTVEHAEYYKRILRFKLKLEITTNVVTTAYLWKMMGIDPLELFFFFFKGDYKTKTRSFARPKTK